MPSAATPISVLKSLLFQVFNLRLGNMDTYHAIVRAYEGCRLCPDEPQYENYLWAALEEAFKKPLEDARDLVVVIDGMDELQGGKPAAQAFLEKLAECVCDGKRVRSIVSAQTLSLPSGISTNHIAITQDKVHDDIHAVVLKNMMHLRLLTSKPGPEQEQVLDRLARAANGSFVWAILASQWASARKSQEDFGKTIESLEHAKPSTQDLALKLFPKEVSATTKTVLSWILSAERPLSVLEIQKLLSVGPQGSSDNTEEPDVYSVLQGLEPLLNFSDGIIRFTHQDIQHAVTVLVDSGKTNATVEARQLGVLLRVINYTRIVVREEPEPTLDESEPDDLEPRFQEYPLLAYVVRHWPVHFQRLKDPKQPKELTNAMPHTVILPLMERALWTQELPLRQNLDLQKTALQARKTSLTEQSPALLQTTINTAIVCELLGRPKEAAPLYYQCIHTSRTLLNNHSPILIDLGNLYLRLTDSMVECKRTETMTHREEVYKVLITLLERQYGKTSTQVVEIRTILARFYEHIHETERATEIYQKIQEGHFHVHGKDSSQARSISEHLKVQLGKSTDTQKIETRRDHIFEEEDDDLEEERLDIATVSKRLQSIDSERAFVELWQSVSHICRSTAAIEWHEKNIDIALTYSKFLTSQKRTNEASAVLSSVAREYESHQVSISDRILERLSMTASLMKEYGQYAASLSILKRISQVYENFKSSESTQSVEIRREMSTVMTEMVQTTSTAAHGDVLEDIFRASIKDESKPVDAKLMAIAKTLVTQHMDQSKLNEAIEIIHLVLHRTWPTFLNTNTSEMEMTTTFPKETIELVQLMAQCYSRQRDQEGVERALAKFFQAILTPKSIDFALVNKVQTLLIDHYDKRNLPEKAIGVLQKVLPARRTSLGPQHDDTIKTLYELGRRSRSKPRTYPFWIDYYQQVVTYLNGDSETCHPNAMDAIIIVANSYWEDGRYSDAVPVFSVLWRTFVQETKEYPQFKQADFAEKLYERYYQNLEQTGTRFETLYQVTTQYRETCTTIFAAESTIAVQATLSLARICYSSERHMSEALTLYEQASKYSSATTESKSEIQHALSTLYTRQVITQSSTTVKSETVERARVRSFEQYEASTSEFGYSHQTSLARLHEVATLYYKQNKTEAATKELTKAVTEIITKETSSIKMIEAAESIVKSFQSISAVEYCMKMTSEMHRQIVSKDSSKITQLGFDLTKYGRSVLPFLVAMEYRMSTDTSISFSQLMAELTLEMLYYEEYRNLVQSNANLKAILMAASTLRAFLVRTKRQEQVTFLNNEIGTLFARRDGGKMKLLSQASPRIFMVAIMEYLALHTHASFIKAVILASNTRLEQLMTAEHYAEAYDIANCAFEFALENDGYTGPRGISYAFNLASTLAGIGYTKKCSDNGLRKQMLQLSNSIAKKIIDVCKKQDIDLVEIQLHELNRLVVLLGEQEDYETLEWLLTTLWNTREAQRTWSSEVLHNLGRRLVCARYLAGHLIKALRLCEDIAYNLRRTHGATHPKTREMTKLLAQLYTSAGQWYLQHGGKDKNNVDLANQYFAKALSVHEEMLRILDHDSADGVMGDDDDYDSTGAILAEHGITPSDGAAVNSVNGVNGDSTDQSAVARTHLRNLKFAYQLLGSWPRSSSEYENLFVQVQQNFSAETKDMQGPDKWQVKGFGNGKAESGEGAFDFDKVQTWELLSA